MINLVDGSPYLYNLNADDASWWSQLSNWSNNDSEDPTELQELFNFRDLIRPGKSSGIASVFTRNNEEHPCAIIQRKGF
jgi:hypothetical protein